MYPPIGGDRRTAVGGPVFEVEASYDGELNGHAHPARARTTTGRPPRGRQGRHLADAERVARLELEPEAGAGSRAAIAFTSSWPKRIPMQVREPPPNGTYAPFGSAASLRREALGHEPLGVGEDLGQVVARPRAVVDEDTAGDVIAVQLERLDRAPRADPGGRVQAQGLVDRHVQPRQPPTSRRVGGRRGVVLLGEQPPSSSGVRASS